MNPKQHAPAIPLPEPAFESATSLEQTLLRRRSIRAFEAEPMTLDQVAQLAWSAQGSTGADGLRTAPSAGGFNPLELYVVAGDVTGLEAGTYHYEPSRHQLTEVRTGDVRAELAAAALDQKWVADGAAVLVLAAVYERTTKYYGEGSERYVHMDVAHAAQNVSLQVVALGLGTCVVAALVEDRVRTLLGLPSDQSPLMLLPIGRPKATGAD